LPAHAGQFSEGFVGRECPGRACKTRKNIRSSCEAGAVVVASNLSSLPLASLIAGETRKGKLGTVPRAGGTETAEENWRERLQIKIGETPCMASAGTSVPAGAPSSFGCKQVRNNGLTGAIRRPTYRR
jgi:L-2-hydroxyglutarate oxidase LhgO